MHFRISSSLSFQRKIKRHVFLLLFVLTPMHLNWPSNATWKCYRSPRQLISTMKHCWLYITIHSLTIFKWKTRNLRLNLIYLSFFVQYMNLLQYQILWNEFTWKTATPNGYLIQEYEMYSPETAIPKGYPTKTLQFIHLKDCYPKRISDTRL